MAYKFQRGQAILSGGVDQEGSISVKDPATDALVASIGDNGAISGSGNLTIQGTVKILGAAQTAVDVANDAIYFFDATDGQVRRETIGAFMADIAGDGLAAASNQLAVGVDDATIETSGDALRVKDGGIDADALASSVAGDGLTGGGGSALAVGAGALIDVQANVVDVDLTEATEADIAQGDYILFLDGGATGTHAKENINDVVELFKGEGLARTNAELSFDASTISTVLTGSAVSGLDVLAVYDTGVGQKKMTVADLAVKLAGAGITATNGVLATDAGGSIDLEAGETLAEGYNYATGSGTAFVNLPASPSAGDSVTVKAGDLGAGSFIRISRQGSHTIDGETSIDLESPYAAVTLVYLAANNWGLV